MIYGIVLAAATAAPCGAAGTQMDLDACWASRAQQADSHLRVTAARVAYELRAAGTGTKPLAGVQTAWVAARSATCAFEASLYSGGSIAPMIASQCADRMTRARDGRLQAMLDALYAYGHTATPPKPASRDALAELDRVYRLLCGRITPAQRAALTSAQRAWIAYREKACSTEGGACLSELDRARVTDLEDGWIGEQFW